MLHLKPSVHLEKVELFAAQQELHRSGRRVAELFSRRDRRRAHALSKLRRDGRRRRFLDDLLMAPLDGAVAFETVHHVAMRIAKDLHFHVPRPFQPLFQKDGVITKRCGGLPPGAQHRIRQLILTLHDAHPAPAAACRSLHQHRIADLRCGCRKIRRPGDLHGRQRGHTGVFHEPFCR